MRRWVAVGLLLAAAGVAVGAPRAPVRQPPAVDERDDSAVDAPDGFDDGDDDEARAPEERVPAPSPRPPGLPSSDAAGPASPVAPEGPIQGQ